MSNTSQAAHGRWREILPILGVSLNALNGKHQACPACGGTDRFRFDDKHGNGDYFCSGCGAGQGLSLLMKVNGWSYADAAKRVDEIIGNLPDKPVRAQPKKKTDTRTLLRELYRASVPLSYAFGDPVTRYLSARGLRGPYPDAIRFVPKMYHAPSKTDHPGMIATVYDCDGNPKHLHRTYLTNSGSKAPVTPNRMLMPGTFPPGGAIRLGDPAPEMGVAEGIETALAASQRHGMPVWSTVAEGFLRTWEPPAAAERIVIFADNDANFVGQVAAYDLAKRLGADGLKVSVMIPEFADTDWNDVLTEEIDAHAA